MTEPLALPNSDETSRAVLIAMLPGPDRKRRETLYQYRLIYREPHFDAEGCLFLWQVVGGRQSYQVALERDDRGRILWHCTCADHIFRSETGPDHACKHIRGLRDFVPGVPLAKAA
jgi:hypothetical protein